MNKKKIKLLLKKIHIFIILSNYIYFVIHW